MKTQYFLFPVLFVLLVLVSGCKNEPLKEREFCQGEWQNTVVNTIEEPSSVRFYVYIKNDSILNRNGRIQMVKGAAETWKKNHPFVIVKTHSEYMSLDTFSHQHGFNYYHVEYVIKRKE